VDAEELKRRTKQFGLRVIRLIEALPSSRAASMIGRQLLRSGTSVGAHYRAASRAARKPDAISRIGAATDAVDESLYWMEMLVEAKLVPADKLAALTKEAGEILTALSPSTRKPRGRVKPSRRR
jgi:four helix bundle protein